MDMGLLLRIGRDRNGPGGRGPRTPRVQAGRCHRGRVPGSAVAPARTPGSGASSRTTGRRCVHGSGRCRAAASCDLLFRSAMRTFGVAWRRETDDPLRLLALPDHRRRGVGGVAAARRRPLRRRRGIWWGESVPRRAAVPRCAGAGGIRTPSWMCSRRRGTRVRACTSTAAASWTADDDGVLFFVEKADQRIWRSARRRAAPAHAG